MVKKTVAVVLSSSLLLSGCASSTLINSVPPGAKVYIDGQYLGHAPATQKDTAILGSSKTVVLKLEGYRDRTGTIRKDEIQAGPLVAGIFLTIPLLWMMGYPAQYTFELEEEDRAERHP
jgi:hypothetical protein